MEFLCEYDFEIKHIKGKENKVVDALSRKVHEILLASISIFQSDLRQHNVNHTVEYELFLADIFGCFEALSISSSGFSSFGTNFPALLYHLLILSVFHSIQMD